MKAAVFDGKEIKIKIVTNTDINDSQVLVRVKAVGICGTDIAIIYTGVKTRIECPGCIKPGDAVSCRRAPPVINAGESAPEQDHAVRLYGDGIDIAI